MKINSRYTDFYDFLSCSSYDDTVIYDRHYSTHEYFRKDTKYIDNTGVSYILFVGDEAIQIKLKTKSNSITWRVDQYEYPVDDEPTIRYCEIKKTIIHQPRLKNWRFVDPIIGHDIHFGIPKGKVIIPTLFVNANNSNACEINYINSTKLRKAFNIIAPVALLDLTRLNNFSDIPTAKLYNNISIQNSGFLQFIDYNDLEMIGGYIDAYLCTQDNYEDIITIENDVRLVGAGFDTKTSFRNRK